MPESIFIEKDPKRIASQDYRLLREAGLRQIEKLAHDLWTDYNIHDPGITILELLAYAITDLGYRTGYEMKDLLTEEVNGVVQNNSNFHTALYILPCNPVTFDDLRLWLIDIDGVRQAWISKHRSVVYCLDTLYKKLKDECTLPGDETLDPLNGLFDVLLEYEDYVLEERIAPLGLVARLDPPAGGFITPGQEGLLFKVRHPLEIRAVHVYPGAANLGVDDNLTVRLFRREIDGTLTEITGPDGPLTATLGTERQDKKTRVELHFHLDPGFTYLLTAEGSLVDLYRENAGDFRYYLPRLVELISGYDGVVPDNAYYYFYDWEIAYAVSPLVIDQLAAAAPVSGTAGLPDNTSPPGGAYINTGNRGLYFDVHCPLVLESVGVYPEVAGPVTVRLLDIDGVVLQSKTFQLTNPGAINQVTLDWEISPGLQYALDAAGTTLRLYRSNNPGFPFALDQALEITAGRNNAGAVTANRYFFFYNWQVTYRPCLPQVTELTKDDIRLAVKERLHLVRNLCEDFVNIRDLRLENIGVCADLEVRPDVDIHEVLAEIFYQLELYVSPPVNFYTIEELQARGKTTDQIFEGPLLDHGFIDYEEFRRLERRCFLRTSDIIQIIMDIPGVVAVKEISLLSFVEITDPSLIEPGDQVVVIDGKQYWYRQEPWVLELQDTGLFAPNFDPDRSKFIFYKNGLPYFPNRSRVIERYEEKRAQNVSSKLKGHERDLPVPVGTFKDLEDYYPIQHDLPETYRVGRWRVPRSSTDLRKAQSRQLKAFLMFFEQILANYLSQLANVRSLFSWEPGAIRSYFTQVVSEKIADIEDLFLDLPGLEGQLWDIIESQATAQERKNRFLDHLIGRYAEDFTEYGLLMYSLYREDAPPRLIRDKQCFLADYPKVSSERGKAYDYRYPEEPTNLTGFQRRLYRLLGIRGEDCGIFRRNFSTDRFQLVKFEIDGEDRWRIIFTAADDTTLIFFETYIDPDNPCETKEQTCSLLDNLIPFGADPDNWRWNAAESRWELFRVCNGEEQVFGYTADPAIVTMEDLQAMIIDVWADYAQREGFHVIEHILLRKRTLEDPFLPVEVHSPGDECDCVEVRDPYSFRATVILPSWPDRFQRIRFRQYVEQLLRLEAPAHVYLKICWISFCEMQHFESCYNEWQRQHAALPPEFRGELPLPAQADLDTLTRPQMEDYTVALQNMIDCMHRLTTVFPMARLHDCQGEASGEEPPITLNNTNLGSL